MGLEFMIQYTENVHKLGRGRVHSRLSISNYFNVKLSKFLNNRPILALLVRISEMALVLNVLAPKISFLQGLVPMNLIRT